MEISEWVVIALVSLAHQQFLTRRQGRAEALIKICETNRQLVITGLENPDLFKVIGPGRKQDEMRRRYLQIWLDQAELMFRLNRFGLFQPVHWHGLERDIRDFMGLPAMRDHWQASREHYADDFRLFVDKVVYTNEGEAPVVEASPEKSGSNQASST